MVCLKAVQRKAPGKKDVRRECVGNLRDINEHNCADQLCPSGARCKWSKDMASVICQVNGRGLEPPDTAGADAQRATKEPRWIIYALIWFNSLNKFDIS